MREKGVRLKNQMEEEGGMLADLGLDDSEEEEDDDDVSDEEAGRGKAKAKAKNVASGSGRREQARGDEDDESGEILAFNIVGGGPSPRVRYRVTFWSSGLVRDREEGNG